MVHFHFPLVKYSCFFVLDRELENKDFNVINERDDEEIVDVTIPENWLELSHNERLDCAYQIERILNDLANRFQTEGRDELIKFTVNQKINAFMQTEALDVDQQFRITFQNFYEDFMTLYKASKLELKI